MSLCQYMSVFLFPARSRSVMTGDPMAACNWAASPNLLERPLKIGWLKKQRSIVKNWQQASRATGTLGWPAPQL
uniref:Uncharacterized protein n=1 Tax=Gopherus agassizii TaxID=38772 RepID=A0A452GLG4_9SAUR